MTTAHAMISYAIVACNYCMKHAATFADIFPAFTQYLTRQCYCPSVAAHMIEICCKMTQLSYQ